MGGAFAGMLLAYGESLFILASVGPFRVDVAFLLKALVLYGLAGMAGGALFSSVLIFAFALAGRPRPKKRAWAFFFPILLACGLTAEAVFYLMDIHTFRDLGGRWSGGAYAFLALGSLSALAAGLLAWRICRPLSQKSARFRFGFGALCLFGLLAVFASVRVMIPPPGPAATRIPSGGRDQAPLNIVILLVDSLRPDHLSAYGYPLPTSPRIDRLAREGVLFRRCYAASNWTVPTHASLFTGLYPSSHGCYSMYSSLEPSLRTLAQILADQGYRTGSFFDNRLLGSRYGLSRGFQTALGANNEHKVSLLMNRLWERFRGDRSMCDDIFKIAAQWIEYAPARKRPFFMFANFLDTHLPYRPKKPYIDDFLRSLPDQNVNRKTAGLFTTDGIDSKKAANDLYPRLTAADWRWLERFYDSNIRYIDDQVDGFLERLRAAGMLSRTLVIVTSDHGEFFGEAGIGGHLHSSLNDAGLRIPLILWCPERLAPADIERPVSQVDILPTILTLAGLPGSIPGAVQGSDLFSARPPVDLMAEFWDDIRKQFSRAYLSGNWKLIRDPAGEPTLYDLGQDPRETNDLSLARPEILADLSRRLEERLSAMPLRKAGEDERKKKEMEKLLKSLGYLAP